MYKFYSVNEKDWREVPFIKDRLAQKEDIDLGLAIFMVEPKGEKHFPLNINIPRLAYDIDVDTKEKLKVIVIQGEQIGDKKVLGIRYLKGGVAACLLFEVEFIK